MKTCIKCGQKITDGDANYVAYAAPRLAGLCWYCVAESPDRGLVACPVHPGYINRGVCETISDEEMDAREQHDAAW